jgi:hypothetical protein
MDIEQPKTARMFQSLIRKFKQEGFELLITARDYDSTYKILDNNNTNYKKVGKHGGAPLEDKLDAHIDRLQQLLPLVTDFSPDYFVNFISVEGVRIAYGLQIPSIGFNDEPRNVPVCKLIFPFIDNLITPKCIPRENYFELGLDPKKIIRYNGIDEIAWLSEFEPDPSILNQYNLKKGKYVIMRTEPSAACYFIDELKPNETLLNKIFPPIFEKLPDYKYFLLVRSRGQEEFLKTQLEEYIESKNLVITRYVPDLNNLCFYSGLVLSGGGTIVRESSLLNVPSIEFFPGRTAPQEHFLRNNGFPLEHLRNRNKIIEHSINILEKPPSEDRFSHKFKKKISKFENPNDICFNFVKLR